MSKEHGGWGGSAMHAEEGDENDYGRPLLHKAGGGVSMLECATSCCEKPMACCTRWPPRVQQSYYRHPQRWHCGLCSLASLVVLLIVIFAGGHAIANKALKSASMKMEHMKVYDMDDNGFTADVTMSVDNRFPLAATIVPDDIKMAFTEPGSDAGPQAFATVKLPQLSLAASNVTNFTLLGTKVTVGDDEQYRQMFAKFGQSLMAHSLVQGLSLQGSITAKSLGLRFGLDLDQQLHNVIGLNSFSKPPPQILKQRVTGTTENAIHLEIEATMTNPSVSTFDDVGRLSFDVEYDGTKVGTAKTPGDTMALVSGVNNVTLLATLERDTAAGNEEAFLAIMSKFAAGELMTITMLNGRTSKNLLQDSLKMMQLTTSFNGLAVLDVPDRSLDPIGTGNLNISIDANAYNALSHFQTLVQNKAACDVPTFLEASWANLSYMDIAFIQNDKGICPVKKVPVDSSVAPYCASTGYTSNSAYLYAYVLLNNPLNQTVSFTRLHGDLAVAPDQTPIRKQEWRKYDYSAFQKGFHLGSMNDKSGSRRKSGGSAAFDFTAPTPLITLKPFERVLMAEMACIDVCVGLFTGTTNSTTGKGVLPGLLTSTSGAGPSYAQARYFSDTPYQADNAADYLYHVGQRPAALTIEVTGSAQVKIGNLEANLTIPTSVLPMTAYFTIG